MTLCLSIIVIITPPIALQEWSALVPPGFAPQALVRRTPFALLLLLAWYRCRTCLLLLLLPLNLHPINQLKSPVKAALPTTNNPATNRNAPPLQGGRQAAALCFQQQLPLRCGVDAAAARGRGGGGRYAFQVHPRVRVAVQMGGWRGAADLRWRQVRAGLVVTCLVGSGGGEVGRGG